MSFPQLEPKPHLGLSTVLESQIYIVDDILTHDELLGLMEWTKSMEMEGPKKAGKGEAERTSRRSAVHSPEIASKLLNLLSPQIQSLNPTTPIQLSPNIRLYHYPPKTYFRPHYDTPQLDPTSRRLSSWTILIYLTTPIGGSTVFHLSDPNVTKQKIGTGSEMGRRERLLVEAKAGRVCFHWHGVTRGGCLLHEGEEVLSGDKWVLRTDILG
ncbi:hypothetical protein TREMEDRAFT_36016 [Tremella mesenterica DSM 1558]|uniref:uncharacterized protein n=1 Tax=Tremella mesenterica (strain ATCC 24925 / CBS 8224 / DSM 1558 / NBRC 9311 / NRRL Y-6157 / RJB 2259-6 / UBC 559-6) TaxID=578456 RepID=UPI00032C3E82|nr:uncharacterized protein TREMEDRAFT_36016 [Tremella mesenterica DSM 1558]EIW65790.1 hypothetical protein TREMEDRAFT_36016 [Tremella mesenterica DSM 1558]